MYCILGKNDCPWCEKAKVLLEESNTPYVYKNLSYLSEKEREAWLKFIRTELFMNTVPVVFQVVGGYKDLEEKLKQNG